MNALISLLHFCELHGPCVVFCTQALRESESLCDSDLAHDHKAASKEVHSKPSSPPQVGSPSPTLAAHAELPSPPNSFAPRCLQSPPSLPSLHKQAKLFHSFPSQTAPSSCSACTARMPFVSQNDTIQEAKMLITRDDEDPSIFYTGTKTPQLLHLYKAVRIACVRSLTSEFCPGRDGPVFFGDEENGYVMSYLFKIRDSHARGDMRSYSLIILMADRVHLITCWPLIVSMFRSMVTNLQARADEVYRNEKELREGHPAYPFATNNRRLPSIPPAEQFFGRRSATSLRSLDDLLGIKDIVAQIHAQFSYILKLAARRRIEKITPGRRAGSLYKEIKSEYEQKKIVKKNSEEISEA